MSFHKHIEIAKPTKARVVLRSHEHDDAIAELQRVIDIEEKEYNNTFYADRSSSTRDLIQGYRNAIRILKGAYQPHAYLYGDKYVKHEGFIDINNNPLESGVIWVDNEDENNII